MWAQTYYSLIPRMTQGMENVFLWGTEKNNAKCFEKPMKISGWP